ncbi:MAG: LysM peptidoglycan-binding domain-containing protein [Gemmatimonadetes bacterium]|nr:LysM peptidoglycan-binding domain-containing protein [Gemmatimonadota bacterium]MXY82672.1 LysM peptidoglycan-binding domain-containing protein [Gemmatimonadota bacterium]MYA24392.1 LysM peptidoglycan-binding domain-containing protein [Gemmatimonadota bacterium]MYB69961.1 LysM peptidoglycan-binding domain-containing protein [Gemmatimonadota bacterium]
MSRPVYILVALLLCALALDAAERRSPSVHVVKRGDTLSEIAVRYRVSQEQIRRWNKLRSSRIYTGQKLKVGSPARSGDWYRVRRGDTLSKIARQFAIPVYKLKAINRLDGDVIHVGQKLRLKSAAPARSASADDHDEEPREYTVRRGDTLSKIALRFDVGLGFLRQLNKLKSDLIRPGQKLRLRASRLEEAVHVVKEGETLTEIARRYRVSVSQLQRLNALVGDRILIGQKLRLKDAASTVHIVERGDALWEIARAYGISVYRLKILNGLRSNRIYPGQELKLYSDRKLEPSGPRLATYVVKRGDYLAQIARLHQMSVAEITRLNKLKKNAVIHPGDRLKVRPMRWVELSEINWDDLQIRRADTPKIASDNGPYYFSRPRNKRQPSKKYYEPHPSSPRQTYRQAARLWREFEHKVGSMGRLSSRLEGWHIVLDPGHGGLDPGALVSARDGKGNRLYVVEDEYVFDIALRVYVLARLHGAQVTMTLLSPNHLIRQSEPPTQTFVHEKNEVYNWAAYNQTNKLSAWPCYNNLETRVRIARQAFANAPRGRRIFLSLHADSSPKAPEAPLVLYYKSSKGRVDRVSRQFARSLLPALGAGAHVRGQVLGVLRNNPADVKVLIEVRNMAYRDHVWALRFEDLRHRDAEKVVRGLLDHAASSTLRAGY